MQEEKKAIEPTRAQTKNQKNIARACIYEKIVVFLRSLATRYPYLENAEKP